MLAGTGLTSELFADPNFRIEFSALQQFILNAIELTGEPDLGSELAGCFEVNYIGLPAYAAMNAACLEDALEVLTRFFGLAFASIEFSFSKSKIGSECGEAAIQLRPRHAFDKIEYFVFSSALIVCRKLLTAALRKEQSASRAEITINEPSKWDKFSAEIGHVPIRFAARENRLIFPAELLNQPLPGADPIDHKRLLELCERFAVVAADEPSLINQVQTFLETGQNFRIPLSKAAESLGYSERGLRRQLERLGTSYRKLVDEVRERRAREMLAESKRPIQAIAFDLGYDTPSNFARSFKRWTGVTPKAFREPHSADGNSGQK